MPSIAIPPKESLTLLYVTEELSLFAIAKQYSVSAPTIRKWLEFYGIALRAWDPKAPRKAKGNENKNQPAIEEDTEAVEGTYLAVDTSSSIENGSAPIVPFAKPEPDDDELTAFDRCSRRQQMLLLLVDFSTPIKPTATAIASKYELEVETVSRWLRDPNFKQAWRELSDENFRFYMAEALRAWCATALADGKTRPEDRRLIAELSGLSKGNGTLINTGVIFAVKGRF